MAAGWNGNQDVEVLKGLISYTELPTDGFGEQFISSRERLKQAEVRLLYEYALDIGKYSIAEYITGKTGIVPQEYGQHTATYAPGYGVKYSQLDEGVWDKSIGDIISKGVITKDEMSAIQTLYMEVMDGKVLPGTMGAGGRLQANDLSKMLSKCRETNVHYVAGFTEALIAAKLLKEVLEDAEVDYQHLRVDLQAIRELKDLLNAVKEDTVFYMDYDKSPELKIMDGEEVHITATAAIRYYCTQLNQYLENNAGGALETTDISVVHVVNGKVVERKYTIPLLPDSHAPNLYLSSVIEQTSQEYLKVFESKILSPLCQLTKQYNTLAEQRDELNPIETILEIRRDFHTITNVYDLLNAIHKYQYSASNQGQGTDAVAHKPSLIKSCFLIGHLINNCDDATWQQLMQNGHFSSSITSSLAVTTDYLNTRGNQRIINAGWNRAFEGNQRYSTCQDLAQIRLRAFIKANIIPKNKEIQDPLQINLRVVLNKSSVDAGVGALRRWSELMSESIDQNGGSMIYLDKNADKGNLIVNTEFEHMIRENDHAMITAILDQKPDLLTQSIYDEAILNNKVTDRTIAQLGTALRIDQRVENFREALQKEIHDRIQRNYERNKSYHFAALPDDFRITVRQVSDINCAAAYLCYDECVKLKHRTLQELEIACKYAVTKEDLDLILKAVNEALNFNAKPFDLGYVSSRRDMLDPLIFFQNAADHQLPCVDQNEGHNPGI